MVLDFSSDGFAEAIEIIDDRIEDLQEYEVVYVGTPVEYAVYLEFGTSKMDPKPFFRPTIRELRTSDLRAYVAKYTGEDLDRAADIGEAVELVGKAARNNVKAVIQRKGLIESGRLLRSITVVPANRRGELQIGSAVRDTDLDIEFTDDEDE